MERQYRLLVGTLPIAYRSEVDGRYLYVLDRALVCFVGDAAAARSAVPVPPCITATPLGDATEAVLEIDDKVTACGLCEV